MGITGTWSGFVADTWTPYNYGNFGNGFGSGNISVEYSSRYGYSHSQGASCEASSIKIWGTNNSSSSDTIRLISYFGNINFTPYGTLHVVLDSCYQKEVYILDTSSNAIASSGTGKYNTDELTINLSNVNITGKIKIQDASSFGLDGKSTYTYHIYKIWFT